MSEVTEAIQLLYMMGKGTVYGTDLLLHVPGKVYEGGAKLVQGGRILAEQVQIRVLQFRLLAQFKNKGVYETCTLKQMDQITGGNYRLLKIPIERGMEDYEEEAVKFFDAMKTLQIPFAEMPDINIGDGFMEIAFNPQDADRIKNLMQEYNFPTGRKAAETSIEDYLSNTKKEDFISFQEQAVNNAQIEMKQQQGKEGELVQLPENYPSISLKELLEEEKTNFLARVIHPGCQNARK